MENNNNIKLRLNRSELAVPGTRVEFFEKAAQQAKILGNQKTGIILEIQKEKLWLP